jgi:hypothetical protein
VAERRRQRVRVCRLDRVEGVPGFRAIPRDLGRERKKFWLLPIVLVVVLLEGVIVFTQGLVVAAFIYTLF